MSRAKIQWHFLAISICHNASLRFRYALIYRVLKKPLGGKTLLITHYHISYAVQRPQE
jgi:hypothetical protein